VATVEEMHGRILKKAVELANQTVTDDATLPLHGALFEANPLRGLSMEILPGVPAEFIPKMRAIAVQAVKQAILDEDIREDFAGLIVGAARQGGNYFDSFK
jgi:hypothetical protein